MDAKAIHGRVYIVSGTTEMGISIDDAKTLLDSIKNAINDAMVQEGFVCIECTDPIPAYNAGKLGVHIGGWGSIRIIDGAKVKKGYICDNCSSFGKSG